MNFTEISNLRLQNQQVLSPEYKTPKELVSWMGAMQAQDFSMAKWGIGLRLGEPSEKSVEEAFNRGEILRTHVLRPTWHFVTKEDIRWMLSLSSERIKNSSSARHRELELTGKVFAKSRNILEKVLSGGVSLTREELSIHFNMAKLQTNENRLSHILQEAETDGVICSGPLKNKKQTHALLDERVGTVKIPPKDQVLMELAKRYFTSHGPACLADFTWWSGLSAADSRKALENAKPVLHREIINSQEYWMPASSAIASPGKTALYLLPAFDEFLISYKDRSACISPSLNKKAISDNGIFRPVIVENGQVIGLWKRTTKKESLSIETSLFNASIKKSGKELDLLIQRFISFHGKIQA